jgi:hypothetical protein
LSAEFLCFTVIKDRNKILGIAVRITAESPTPKCEKREADIVRRTVRNDHHFPPLGADGSVVLALQTINVRSTLGKRVLLKMRNSDQCPGLERPANSLISFKICLDPLPLVSLHATGLADTVRVNGIPSSSNRGVPVGAIGFIGRI